MGSKKSCAPFIQLPSVEHLKYSLKENQVGFRIVSMVEPYLGKNESKHIKSVIPKFLQGTEYDMYQEKEQKQVFLNL